MRMRWTNDWIEQYRMFWDDQRRSVRPEFSRPFKATNQVNFRLVSSEGGTRVSWIMDGKNNFMTKFMSIVMDMDKMVGTDFEQGLANLNTVAQDETQRSGQSARANAKEG
jgi:hypothetical protein